MCEIYIDGGSRGNPGDSAIGFIILDNRGNELFRYGKKIGYHTNNFAEYSALIEVLGYITKNGFLYQDADHIIIYSDSELLVNQIRGRYKVKSKNIIPLFQKVQKLMNKQKNIKIDHIKREKNKAADWIVNRILDGKNADL